MMRQWCSCSTWRSRAEQRSIPSLWWTPTRAGGCLKESATLWETRAGPGSWQTFGPVERTPIGAGSWQALWHAGDLCWTLLPEGLPSMEETYAGAVPARRIHDGVVHRGLSPMGGTPKWSGGKVWGVLTLRRKQWKKQYMTLSHPMSL